MLITNKSALDAMIRDLNIQEQELIAGGDAVAYISFTPPGQNGWAQSSGPQSEKKVDISEFKNWKRVGNESSATALASGPKGVDNPDADPVFITWFV